MKRAAIVFHSVCGNTYLLACEYQRTLRDLGIDASLYRVHDPNFEQFAQMCIRDRCMVWLGCCRFPVLPDC